MTGAKVDRGSTPGGTRRDDVACGVYNSFLIDLVKTRVADKTLRRPHSLAHAGRPIYTERAYALA